MEKGINFEVQQSFTARYMGWCEGTLGTAVPALLLDLVQGNFDLPLVQGNFDSLESGCAWGRAQRPVDCIQPAKTSSSLAAGSPWLLSQAQWAVPPLLAAGSWLILSWDLIRKYFSQSSSQTWKDVVLVDWAENEGCWRKHHCFIRPALSSCFSAVIWVPEFSVPNAVGCPSGSVQSSNICNSKTWSPCPSWSQGTQGLHCCPLWIRLCNRPPREPKLLAFHQFKKWLIWVVIMTGL